MRKPYNNHFPLLVVWPPLPLTFQSLPRARQQSSLPSGGHHSPLAPQFPLSSYTSASLSTPPGTQGKMVIGSPLRIRRSEDRPGGERRRASAAAAASAASSPTASGRGGGGAGRLSMGPGLPQASRVPRRSEGGAAADAVLGGRGSEGGAAAAAGAFAPTAATLRGCGSPASPTAASPATAAAGFGSVAAAVPMMSPGMAVAPGGMGAGVGKVRWSDVCARRAFTLLP